MCYKICHRLYLWFQGRIILYALCFMHINVITVPGTVFPKLGPYMVLEEGFVLGQVRYLH